MKFVGALLILVMIWAVGLVAFAAHIDQSTPAADPPVSDGVVALTGASDARIMAAMKLLESGKARRMLVSGVNPLATRKDMKGVVKATQKVYDCCVDLGYQATDTIGNARETAHWANAQGYTSLILVTSDFHMPRAMLELKAALPDTQITAYPIRTTELDAKHWWRNKEGVRRMVLEYSKYLAILGQHAVTAVLPKNHHALDDPPPPGTPLSAARS